jgi:hypothetical protein
MKTRTALWFWELDPNGDDIDVKLRARNIHKNAPAGDRLSEPILDRAAFERLAQAASDEREWLNDLGESPRGGDPNEDPASAWQRALAEACEQIATLDSGELAELQYELIDKLLELYRKKLPGKMDDHIVPEVIKAFKYFKVGGTGKLSRATVYNARQAVEEKRAAEEAHTEEVTDPPGTTKT